jgi:hypothetical protein
MYGHELGEVADLGAMDALTSVQAGDVYRIARDILISNWNMVPKSDDPEIVKNRVLTGTALAAFVASKYRNLVQAQDNSIPTPAQVMSDSRLAQLVTRYGPQSSIKGASGSMDWSLNGQIIPGVKNMYAYAAIGLGAVALLVGTRKR